MVAVLAHLSFALRAKASEPLRAWSQARSGSTFLAHHSGQAGVWQPPPGRIVSHFYNFAPDMTLDIA
jgi:hypothetical protein